MASLPADFDADIKQIGRFVITLIVLVGGFICLLRNVDVNAVTPIMAGALGHYLGAERGKSGGDE